MPFLTSPCDIIHKSNNSSVELYKKFIFSIIVFELVIVIVSILYSTIKNSQIKNDKRQTKLQKKLQIQSGKSVTNQIKAQVIHTSLSIYDTFKSGKSLKSKKIMNVGQNSLDIDICESVVLEKNTNRIIKGMEMKRQVQIQNSSVKQGIDKQDSKIIYQQKSSPSFSFISLGNLRLSQDKASIYFNILLGHFFISGGLSMQICPELATSIASGVHCILFLVLLVFNASFNEKRNNEAETKKEEQKIQSSIKQKINTIASALIFVINICLLAYSIIRMKQSYFNVAQIKCL